MKARLGAFDHDSLVSLLRELHAASATNRRFLHSRLTPGSRAIAEYRQLVADATYPEPFSKRRVSVRDAAAAIVEYSVMYPPAIDRFVARVPNAAALKASILAHQTSAEDAGHIAQDAGVKTLVLSHFVPPDDSAVTDAMGLDSARRHFRGTVIVGKDLLEI